MTGSAAKKGRTERVAHASEAAPASRAAKRHAKKQRTIPIQVRAPVAPPRPRSRAIARRPRGSMRGMGFVCLGVMI